MNLHHNISDKELSQRIKNNEKNAFQELYERYAPKIYQISYSYLKNSNDSKELVQNVFLKIWEKRELLDTSQNIKSFIFKIAVNTIYDFIRHKNIEHAFEDYARLNYTKDDNYTWHTVIFNEMKENLQSLVEKMPEKQQEIFQLSKFEGLNNTEIANRLNLSKRTVENHLYRAIAFLKEHFERDSIISLLFFYLICA